MSTQELSLSSLVSTLTFANDAYRAGNTEMSDTEYDRLLEELRQRDPSHPFLHQVEPEPGYLFSGTVVTHANPMLSTDKAYSAEDLQAFFARVERAAQNAGLSEEISYSAKAKLDGLAGRIYYHNGKPQVSTRGNGAAGNDITHALHRGLVVDTEPNFSGNHEDGEIVLDEAFFQEKIKPLGFKAARNVMVGFVSSDESKEHHAIIGKSRKARFVSYATLPAVCGEASYFLRHLSEISEQLRHQSLYATDGIVISVDDLRIRQIMGATSHHHRWQIAYKTKADTTETTVVTLHWQTGRTGRVTPVIEVEPVELSGATVRRATAHTAKMVERLGVGPGSRITLIRSGEVIPKIEAVLESVPVALPEHCPSCGHALEEDGEYLICPSLRCDAQIEGRIIHFFKTLGNADGFGPKAAEKLVASWAVEISEILDLNADDFVNMDFGPGQAKNLQEEIFRCIHTPIEDWRFLAAFGIRHLGRGDSRHLLEALPDFDALAHLDWETIAGIDGFAEKTAKSIASDLQALWPEIQAVRAKGFTLLPSRATQTESQSHLPLASMALVFTGTFAVPREELEAEAQRLGAQVQSVVSRKTTAVVVGDKPGASKRKKAHDLSIPLWSQEEYRRHIS